MAMYLCALGESKICSGYSWGPYDMGACCECYDQRVVAYEIQGIPRTDAQAIVEAELTKLAVPTT